MTRFDGAMSNMTIAWMILSVPVFFWGFSVFYNTKPKGNPGVSALCSMVFFLPLWWGAYFLIQ